eukprot:467199-Amphidinium_carterae.1
MDSEIHTAVIDGIPRSNGDPTWRAEVTVPREGGAGPLGRRGTTNIRGPNRVDRNLVHGDIDKLVQAYKDGGSQLIRQTQRDLNRSWHRAAIQNGAWPYLCSEVPADEKINTDGYRSWLCDRTPHHVVASVAGFVRRMAPEREGENHTSSASWARCHRTCAR